ncbi:hypothetical protein MTO96_017992 [Rhipicephalus appendiculatus]
MGKCCIPGCRNSRERIPGLTFHQIPSNEPWRASWMEVLTKNGVKAFTEWTLVCGEHFTHEDYKMTARKNFLLPSAVPSVFTIKPCRNAPKKRGRKPKALLQQQQQQLAATRLGEPQRVTVLSEDLPQAATPDAEALQGSEDVAKQQPPKNLNVIVFTNQPRPASTLTRSRTDDHNSAGVVDDPSSDYPGNPRRRCCQIQTQRLLFYKSVITKLRKRVLALEASLAEKEKELASIEAQRDLDMVL